MHPHELRHLQLQAILRDTDIPESQLKYAGKIDGEHTYIIDGDNIVPVSKIVDCEEVIDD